MYWIERYKVKHLALTICLIFCSCSKHESKETVEPTDRVDDIAASYLDQLNGFSEEKLFPDRCDRLTFLALSATFVKDFDISKYEWESGEWHRDIYPCWPKDSQSEISYDGLLSVLHYALRNDDSILFRMRSYGKEHKWVMGEGDKKLTYNPQLLILINGILGEHILGTQQERKSTHKEHILASSIWLKMRYSSLNDVELLTLKNLKQTPLRDALIARMKDGNQSETIKYLESFPEKLPLEVGHENWGGCPRWLYFFILKAVIDGK